MKPSLRGERSQTRDEKREERVSGFGFVSFIFRISFLFFFDLVQSGSWARTSRIRMTQASLRLCIDYQAHNNTLNQKRARAATHRELFDQLGAVRYFTKLDWRPEYYQVWILEGLEGKTTWGWSIRLSSNAGLTNASFCTKMNEGFRPTCIVNGREVSRSLCYLILIDWY